MSLVVGRTGPYLENFPPARAVFTWREGGAPHDIFEESSWLSFYNDIQELIKLSMDAFFPWALLKIQIHLLGCLVVQKHYYFFKFKYLFDLCRASGTTALAGTRSACVANGVLTIVKGIGWVV